ncbi:protoheme IX farnesyltransferase [Maricaulis sp.]|uniref:protoheme IX farnesyltransferase n=1 Tax=Maricaulis sp. TaxID=1486257 RepID=UPI002B27948A|nr:protoheme IX farnesyltransferase [Maricaulis sp.]
MTQDNDLMSAREGLPTGETVKLTPEQEGARNKRNIVIAWSLVGFMVAVFAITVVRLGQTAAAGAGA